MFSIFTAVYLNGKTIISPFIIQRKEETDSIHVYSADWGRWLKNGHKVF